MTASGKPQTVIYVVVELLDGLLWISGLVARVVFA
jgi:hypothetical protein